MLIKAELKKVPPCECPKITKRELSKNKANYLVAAKICEIPRCGQILVVDYYKAEFKELQARFFYDKKNYIILLFDENNEVWENKTIINCLDHPHENYYSLADYNLSAEFVGKRKQENVSVSPGFYCNNQYVKGLIGLTAQIAFDKNEEARLKESNRKYERMSKHLSYFPKKYPKSVDLWADSKAFGGTYIFFSNLDKKRKRKGLCGHCGKSFMLPADIKHKAQTECPKCHTKAQYCAERYRAGTKDKALICYAFEHEKQLCLEWSEAVRTYGDSGKPHISYETQARTLYLIEKGKQKIYSYGYQFIRYYWGSYWSSWGNTPVYRKAFIYSDNLNSIFGDRYYNVDLKKLVENEMRTFDFVKLLDNLKNIPQCEYLCKLGLTALASELDADEYADGKSFGQCLGINQQYLPLYRDYGVTRSEHHSIKTANEFVTPEWLVRYRTLKAVTDYIDIDSLMPYMTINKFSSYITKQHDILPKVSLGQIALWLRDYIRMNETLDVRLDKNNMFPKDIKKAHDDVLKRYNEVKSEIESKASKEALALVNSFFKGYEKDGFTVFVPKEKADFVREGQELSHCVGIDRYYQNHIAGKMMIFFIRRISKPDKAYYTAEIDMFDFRVTQCYGYGDKPAIPEVRKFINEFARWLKSQKQKLRKAG